jgi:hypothetical protein
MTVLLPLLWVLQVSSADTLEIRSLERPPLPGEAIDTGRLGSPQIRLRTGQGKALVWLLRAADTVFVAVSIPDSSPYWGDDFVLSLDTEGDGAPTPQHDDFQWYFRRVLDSSVVYRGRNGRWQPPRDDPDWRLGTERSGGGWEVTGRNDPRGWSVLVRLDPAWLKAEDGRLPRVAFRIYDDAPGGWYAWPLPRGTAPPTTVERTPALWSVVK